jgi:hypothetical protein
MQRLFTDHWRAAFGAFLLVARFADPVFDLVTAVGADTVSARPGGFGATHPARTASLALTLAACVSSSHGIHLLSGEKTFFWIGWNCVPEIDF